MESSMRFGLMAVFAVSGSMVLLAHQVHKRILSNFMKKFEFEMSGIIYPKKFNGIIIFILFFPLELYTIYFMIMHLNYEFLIT
jgi:hypothetical protein